MRPSSTLLLTLGTCATAKRVVPVSFARQRDDGLVRRDDSNNGTLSQGLLNNISPSAYYANVSVGTPPQMVYLVVDTGSADVWVLDSHADLCQSSLLQAKYGECLATYDPEKSDSYKVAVEDGFNITYADLNSAAGDYIKDDFHIAGATVSALQMGLASNTTINSGVLGIGFDTSESTLDIYPNIVTLLVRQGLIDAEAYSLFLDDLDAEQGTILFGGIDTEKYTGELKVVDILPDGFTGKITSFSVALTSLAISPPDADEQSVLTEPISVVLDSGTTLTYLPEDVAADIYDAVGAIDDSVGTGLVYISCSVVDSDKWKDTTFDFQFDKKDGPLIRVGLADLVINNVADFVSQGFQIPNDLPFDDPCSFGIQSLEGYYLLGDTFLRSAYVVYDLTNRQIGLAQANPGSDSSNILEINKAEGIPLVTGAASTASATSTATTSSTSSTTAASQPTTTTILTTAASSTVASSTGLSSTSATSTTAAPTGPNTNTAAARRAPPWTCVSGVVTLMALSFSFAGASLFTL
ncbi:aspartic peptidase domain-containing protein [Xylariaceae sp. FL1019]|nr:aspartic peptidase domain-containing protein [Xylariaceae sp. FL1019]